MIKLKNVSVKYKIYYDRISSIKEYIITVIKRRIKYEDFWALKNISFTIKKGEVYGLLGRNGAGKSTLLKVISKILKPTTGSVHIKGSIAPLLELGSGFDSDLTGRENIYLNGAILGHSKKFLESKLDEIIEFSELGKFIDVPIRNYSSGMVVRLAFSIATIASPEVLIIDEILAVGDMHFQEKSKNRMLELIKGGTTVLFVSHNINQVKEICNKAIWLEHGQIKAIGNAKEVCDKYEESFKEENK